MYTNAKSTTSAKAMLPLFVGVIRPVKLQKHFREKLIMTYIIPPQTTGTIDGCTDTNYRISEYHGRFIEVGCFNLFRQKPG